MSAHEFEFGLDSPAYVSVDESGQPLDGDVVIRNTIEEAVFAVQHRRAGDVHHRPGPRRARHCHGSCHARASGERTSKGATKFSAS
jgi:hypothetical protein